MQATELTRRPPPPLPRHKVDDALKSVVSNADAKTADAKTTDAKTTEAKGVDVNAPQTLRATDAAVAAQRSTARAQEVLTAQRLKAAPKEVANSEPARGIARPKDLATGAQETANNVETSDFPPRADAIAQGLEPFAGTKIPDATAVTAAVKANPGFATLSQDDQASTLAQLKKPGDEGKLIRAQVNQALTDKALASASAEEQGQAIGAAAHPELPATPKEALEAVQDLSAFQSLPQEDKRRIENAFNTKGPSQFAMTDLVEQSFQQQATKATETSLVDQLARVARVDADPKLSAEVKGSIAETMTYDRPPYAVSKVLEQFSASDAFQKMSPQQQQAALGETLRLGERTPVTAKSIQRDLQASQAYQGLDAVSKERLDRLTQNQSAIGKNARAELRTLMKTPAWSQGGEKTQQEILKGIQDLGVLPYGVNHLTPSAQPNGTTRVAGKKDVTTTFENGNEGAAVRHAIEIKRGDRTFSVDVDIPKEKIPGRFQPTLSQVRDALSRLPDDQLNSLQRVVVNPDGKLGSGMSTQGDDGIVQVSPAHAREDVKNQFNPGEMSEIFSHEVGHLQSITPWSNDENSAAWKAWDAARAKDGISASDYAKTNGPEDFAETYALYRGLENQPKELAELRKLFPNRFAIIDTLVRQQKNARTHPAHRH